MPYSDSDQQRAYGREWRRKRRLEWIEENGPCRSCGSKIDLQVDHIDPALKVSHRVWSWRKERREAELAKCQVLCYECHLEKTKEQLATRAEHGTYTRYRSRCRCELCMEACRVHWRDYRKTHRRLKSHKTVG